MLNDVPRMYIAQRRHVSPIHTEKRCLYTAKEPYIYAWCLLLCSMRYRECREHKRAILCLYIPGKHPYIPQKSHTYQYDACYCALWSAENVYSTKEPYFSYACVCIYIYIYMYMYTCIYICVYVNIYTYICMYTYIYIYTFVYIHIYVYIYVCIVTGIGRCGKSEDAMIHMHTCMYIYTYIHIYIYTYTHTYIYIWIYMSTCIYMYCHRDWRVRAWTQRTPWSMALLTLGGLQRYLYILMCVHIYIDIYIQIERERERRCRDTLDIWHFFSLGILQRCVCGMYTYICMYEYIHIYVCMYVYLYIQRERESGRRCHDSWDIWQWASCYGMYICTQT